MLRKEIFLVALVFFLIFCMGMGYAEEYIQVIIHIHDTNSDGDLSEQELVVAIWTIGKVKFVFITNHLPCLMRTRTHKNHSDQLVDYFNNPRGQFKKTNSLSKQEHTVGYWRSVEVSTNIKGADILLLGINSLVAQDPEFRKLDHQSAQKILDFAKRHNLITVLPHPHDGLDESLLNNFNCLGFFNNKGYDIRNIYQDKSWKTAESRDLYLYCQSIKNHLANPSKNLLAITGDNDCHTAKRIPITLQLGHTFVRVKSAKSASFEEILQSIKEGKTYATSLSNETVPEIKELNFQPQFQPYQVEGEVNIKAKITISPVAGTNVDKVIIYRDGEMVHQEELGFNLFGQNSEFDLDFKDNPTPGKHVYFIYILGRLITSPIVVIVKKPTPEIPSPELPSPEEQSISSYLPTPKLPPKIISNTTPSISPNGWYIAYVNNESGYNRLFIVDTNNLQIKQLTLFNYINDTHPAWHPNCREVFFISDLCGRKDLCSIDIWDTHMRKNYTETTDYDSASPCLGTNNILCYRHRGVVKEMKFRGYGPPYKSRFYSGKKVYFYTKNAQVVANVGGQESTLTKNSSRNILTGFLPDWLIYYSNRNGDYDIYSIRVDGQQETRIIAMPGDQTYTTATYVKGEAWLAFQSNHLGQDKNQWDIYLSKWKSKKPTRMTFGSTNNSKKMPSYSY